MARPRADPGHLPGHDDCASARREELGPVARVVKEGDLGGAGVLERPDAIEERRAIALPGAADEVRKLRERSRGRGGEGLGCHVDQLLFAWPWPLLYRRISSFVRSREGWA